MFVRPIASLMFLPFILAVSPAFAAAAPAAQAAPPAQPADPNAPQPPQFSINEPHGDWAVRCALETVKSPAPCDIIQLTINQDTMQRIMSLSLAYVPSRDAYALQVIVPTGVAIARGLTLASGNRPLRGLKYTRCERDGCYVELLVDSPTIAAMAAAGGEGKTTNVTVISYGQFNELNLPVSLNGFPEGLERMRTLARQRATTLPNEAQPPIASGAPAPAGAAPAAPAAAPARGAAAPAAGRAAGR